MWRLGASTVVPDYSRDGCCLKNRDFLSFFVVEVEYGLRVWVTELAIGA